MPDSCPCAACLRHRKSDATRWPHLQVDGVQPSVADEASTIVSGARMDTYGPPTENLQDTADAWTLYLRRAFQARDALTVTDVCALMVLLKQFRQVNAYSRDSMVDTVGYALIAEMSNDKQ